MKNIKTTFAGLAIALACMISLQALAMLIYILFAFTMFSEPTTLQGIITLLCMIGFIAAIPVGGVVYRRISNDHKPDSNAAKWPLLIIVLFALWPVAAYAAQNAVYDYRQRQGIAEIEHNKEKIDAADKAYRASRPPECLESPTILYEASYNLNNWKRVYNEHGATDDVSFLQQEIAAIFTVRDECKRKAITPEQEKERVLVHINTIKKRAQAILETLDPATLTPYEQKLLNQ